MYVLEMATRQSQKPGKHCSRFGFQDTYFYPYQFFLSLKIFPREYIFTIGLVNSVDNSSSVCVCVCLCVGCVGVVCVCVCGWVSRFLGLWFYRRVLGVFGVVPNPRTKSPKQQGR